jgi:hypothetical protein
MAPTDRSQLFTVRIRAEGTEWRGSVRDVASGAFRNFREWSDLTSFLAAQVEEEHATSMEEAR